MIKDIVKWIVVLACVFVLSMLWVNKSHAIEFPSYQYVTLENLVNNANKFNSEEVQIRGTIRRIDQFIGVYGGEYIGLSVDQGIIVLVYASEVHHPLVIGDVILVDGAFHVYALYGGQSHDMFVATHHLELVQ